MAHKELPKTFQSVCQQHQQIAKAVEELGKAAKQAGPIDEKSAQLIQLAAAASIRSEGAVHSHVRRAMDAGANKEEIQHAILLLTSTIGFPTVVAALSWVDDVIGQD
ncbi:MAG TPA: carboxymuconolactone decarboxylase family protein [Porticoccus sp.]|nr:carboxymuconolactone decarboxylase family protein [Porticoccus sp.]